MEDRISKKGGLVEETVKEDYILGGGDCRRSNKSSWSGSMHAQPFTEPCTYLMTEISKHDPEVKDVYVYKFDKHSRLDKCKARLVVWGGSVSQIANR